jgi:hypothetical protein
MVKARHAVANVRLIILFHLIGGVNRRERNCNALLSVFAIWFPLAGHSSTACIPDISPAPKTSVRYRLEGKRSPSLHFMIR